MFFFSNSKICSSPQKIKTGDSKNGAKFFVEWRRQSQDLSKMASNRIVNFILLNLPHSFLPFFAYEVKTLVKILLCSTNYVWTPTLKKKRIIQFQTISEDNLLFLFVFDLFAPNINFSWEKKNVLKYKIYIFCFISALWKQLHVCFLFPSASPNFLAYKSLKNS